MDAVLFGLEKVFLLLGVACFLTGIIRYGKRSQDWKGIVTMFYKRIPMSIAEYRWYRLGVVIVILAIILRIVLLTFWPN